MSLKSFGFDEIDGFLGIRTDEGSQLWGQICWLDLYEFEKNYNFEVGVRGL